MTNTDVQMQAPAKPALSPVEQMGATFAKTKVLAFDPTEDKSVFGAFVQGQMANEAFKASFQDFTEKAPETFSGVALVTTKDGLKNRLVAFADKATALADAVVQDAFYAWYQKRVIRVARAPESTEGQFILPSGVVSVVSGLGAWKFQSAAWVSVLKGKKLRGIDVTSLKTALQNSAFAKSMFPTFTDWNTLLTLMANNAEKHGHSSSIFAHWAATRDLQTLENAQITLGDNDSLLSAVNAIVDEDDEDETDDETATA